MKIDDEQLIVAIAFRVCHQCKMIVVIDEVCFCLICPVFLFYLFDIAEKPYAFFDVAHSSVAVIPYRLFYEFPVVFLYGSRVGIGLQPFFLGTFGYVGVFFHLAVGDI